MRQVVSYLCVGLVGVVAALVQAADPPTMTQGPLLGRPAAKSMAVWARTSAPAEFHVRYGLFGGRLEKKSPLARTSFAHDLTGVAELTDLTPDTRYAYQVFVGELPQGQAGSFRTLPDAALVQDAQHNPRGLFNFRFEIGSCANQNPEHGIGHALPLYQTMNRTLRDDVHFAIMNGDWLYEELRDTPPAAWLAAHRLPPEQAPRVVQQLPTIVGVWENYKLYLSRGAPLAEWHRHTPSLFTFDDHELVNDIWGTGTPGHRHRRTVFRDIGVQAWRDYLGWANPPPEPGQPQPDLHFGQAQFTAGSDLLVDRAADFTRLPLTRMSNLHVHWGTPTAGVNEIKLDDDRGDPNSRVYEIVRVVDRHTLQVRPPAVASGRASYSIGSPSFGRQRVANCEIFLLDTRGQRDMHDVRQPAKPGISMLGKAQREWLLKAMRESDADFFFVVSSTPFTIPHSGAGGFEFDAQNKEEAWVVFLDERELLIREWEKLGKPVLVLTGDLHNSFAIQISDRVWEFCCGPHNSVNHVPALDEANRPATGKFVSGPRTVDIRWSSYILPDLPRLQRLYPYYCVVQVNNAFNNPVNLGDTRWVAYPHPQVVVQYYDGRTGKLAYAEAITKPRK